MNISKALKLSGVNKAIRKQKNGTIMIFGPSGDVEVFYTNANHYAKKPLSALKDYSDWIPMTVNLFESNDYNLINMGYRMSEIHDIAICQLVGAEEMVEQIKFMATRLRMMTGAYERLIKQIK